MNEVPEKIGKYAVRGIAGRGAMGIVYMAHDPFIDRRVAIKVCAHGPVGPDHAVARRMFFNEAQAAGSLDHPNILKVFDAGEVDGELYMVIEYVEGAKTLREFTDADRLLPMDVVLRYAQQCALALDYAHRRGVMHRDIKPANILLTEDGQAKIGDFGIARRMQADQTQDQSALGSPLYMSPEQIRDGELTSQTDLYSLGVAMYQLLTGKTPFVGRSMARLAIAITTERPPRLREHRPELPEALEAVVERAMAKDLHARYATGAEMAADLAHVQESCAQLQDERSDTERYDIARRLAFFNDFSDTELEEVLSVASWARFAPGDRILEQGAVEESFMVIANGEVGVHVGDADVCRLGAGDCIGELGYLGGTKRSASIVARSDVTTLEVNGAVVEWASIPVQMRLNKAFQRTLIERLTRTTLELARRVA